MRPSTWSLVFLVLCLSLSLGWCGGRRHMAAQRMDLRAELWQALADNQALREECLQNLKNQFTPGYRCALVLPNPNQFRLSMRQGEIFQTQTWSDLAIEGSGFFILGDPIQGQLYTRDGRFSLRDGRLRNEQNRPLLGYALTASGEPNSGLVPIETALDPASKLYGGRYHSLRFDDGGVLQGQRVDGHCQPLFQVALAGFENPERLARAEGTLLLATRAANLLREGVSGQGGLGHVLPGSLELSNVEFHEQGLILKALAQHAGLLGEPMPAPAGMARCCQGRAWPPPLAPQFGPLNQPALSPSPPVVPPPWTPTVPALKDPLTLEAMTPSGQPSSTDMFNLMTP
jgi:flagellar basal body rod protein FlgG